MTTDDGPEGKFFSGASLYQEYFQSAMVKIIVGQSPYTKTFYAHEGVLSKSSFFKCALNGSFKESISREVELPEDDPEIFSSVLEYFYGGEYSPRLVLKKGPKVESQQQQQQQQQQISGSFFGQHRAVPVQTTGGFGGPTFGVFGAGQPNIPFGGVRRSSSPDFGREEPRQKLKQKPQQVTSAKAEPGSKLISGYEEAMIQPDQQGAAALRHAKIYCLAEKFELGDLQALVLEKLRLCGPIKDVHFIRVAAYLVEGSSDTRGVLSSFLGPYVQGIP